MTGVLLSGPAGAGKSQAARRIYASLRVPGVIIDFQSLYAALLQLERNPDGRYPERLASDAHVLGASQSTYDAQQSRQHVGRNCTP